MRRRALAVVATQGISPVMAMLVALVIALILLLASPVKAQETTVEETTVLAADPANGKVEAKTDNVSAEVDNGKVSVKTSNRSTSGDTTSQQSSLTVRQDQTTEGRGSQATTGDLNTGSTQTNVKTQNASGARVEVDVLNENGQSTGEGFTARGGDDGSEVIQKGPGKFSLDITAVKASYNITVEDCPESCSNPQDRATFTGRDDRQTDQFKINGNSFRIQFQTDPVNNNGNNNRHHHNRNNNRHHHNRNNNNNDTAAHRQYTSERTTVEQSVIKKTIPNKGQLANTGGLPLVGVAFLALAFVGVGISVLRFAIRRER